MKVRKFNKKLGLNKRTVSHLDNRQMNSIAGGTAATFWTVCGLTCETPNCVTLLTLCDCGSPPETLGLACQDYRD